MSKVFGDPESGFAVSFDIATRTVRVDGWGFWGVGIAPRFREAVLEAFRVGPSARRLELELTRLKPLREEGEEAWLHLVTNLPKMGVEEIVVATNSLTKLQLLRLVRQSVSKNLVQFS